MKKLILVLTITLQMTISSAALAWSPLEGIEAAIDEARRFQHCFLPAVTSDEGAAARQEEEEEEPDCE